MALVRPLRLLLLGAPGSGKGTLTSRLLKQFPTISSLSSGDILRSQLSSGTTLSHEISSYIKEGKLLPDKLMVRLIGGELDKRNWLNKQSTWLLDGFPRTVGQARSLDQVLKPNEASINMVVELDVDQKVIIDRIEARWVHVNSGRVYNLDYNPPKVPFKDDITGEPLTKRDDDTAEVVSKRLDLYNKELQPLKQFYQELNVLHTVSGNTSDIVYPQLAQLVIDNYSHINN
ncbi:adenylate kinase 2 [Scheffersomyces amazonensis]|uniref:adenylate kinase 2 n=1 Tax=Scheffersomyces amazonensis TaxID=1078765 RepID=UPI00315CF70D